MINNYIKEVFNLFPECILLSQETRDINQAGEYIAFLRYKRLNEYDQFDFKIFISCLSFLKDTQNVFLRAEELLKRIQSHRALCDCCILQSRGLELEFIRDGLYVYGLDFFLKARL